MFQLFTQTLVFVILMFPPLSFAAEPGCRAQLNNEVNQVITQISWNGSFYMGVMEGATYPVLITTSLGNDQIMSLWVREKRTSNQAGMFSFVDLSSGKEQYLRFYMQDGYSVGVTCQWMAN